MPKSKKKERGARAQAKRVAKVQIELSPEQAAHLDFMLECVEMWAINSRGCARLWEENKELIEELVSQLYGEKGLV